MSDLRLSIAMGDYDRTRAIADGRVNIDGVDRAGMLLSPEEMFFRAFRNTGKGLCARPFGFRIGERPPPNRSCPMHHITRRPFQRRIAAPI